MYIYKKGTSCKMTKGKKGGFGKMFDMVGDAAAGLKDALMTAGNILIDTFMKIGSFALSYFKNYGFKSILGGARAVVLDFISEGVGMLQGLVNKAGLEVNFGAGDFGFLGNVGYWDRIYKTIKNTNQGLAYSGNFAAQMEANLLKALPDAIAVGSNIGEIAQAYNDLIEATERTKFVTPDDLVAMAELKQVFGQTYSEYFAKSDLAGKSFQRTLGGMKKLTVEANKAGVNVKKVFEELNRNADRMFSYTFRNGLKQFERMALLAKQTKLSMQGAFGLADTLMDGSFEAAIEMGANLQVLGGAFAQMGDPMALMYKARTSPDEFLKDFERVSASIASFNKVTGEIGIDSVGMQHLRQFAKVVGVDFNELASAAVLAREKMELAPIMSANLRSAKDFESILSKIAAAADYDKDIKDWVVNINGSKKRVRDLSEQDVSRLDTMTSKGDDMFKQTIDFNKTLSEALQILVDFYKNYRGISRDGYDYLYGKFKPALDDLKGTVTGDNALTKFMDIINQYQSQTTRQFTDNISSFMKNMPFMEILNIGEKVVNVLDDTVKWTISAAGTIVGFGIDALNGIVGFVNENTGLNAPKIPEGIGTMVKEISNSFKSFGDAIPFWGSEGNKATQPTTTPTQSTDVFKEWRDIQEQLKQKENQEVRENIKNNFPSLDGFLGQQNTNIQNNNQSTIRFENPLQIELNGNPEIIKQITPETIGQINEIIQDEIRKSFTGFNKPTRLGDGIG